jgi:hypothetical protein
MPGLEQRITALDWQRIAKDLDTHGCAVATGDPWSETWLIAER